MAYQNINPTMLKNMFIAGAKNLEAHKNYVDELNVFPVPDGDTGTNMTLTILAAAKEVENIEQLSIAAIAGAMSSGSLRGARGNSGVILSQLFRGFAKAIKESEELDGVILANAFAKASETAYKAVMKPKEGTILTVAKGLATKASEVVMESEDLADCLRSVIEHGKQVLAETPELLAVLKEAGVVDAGGQGLIFVLEGALAALESGQDYYLDDAGDGFKPAYTSNTLIEKAHVADTEITFGYCTEFIVETGDRYTLEQNEANSNEFKAYLEQIGDSIVSVADEDLIKIHVHTNDPGLALQKALTYGSLVNIKIDNMRVQHAERVIKNVDQILAGQAVAEESAKSVGSTEAPVELKENGFIAVSVGSGIDSIFESLGVDFIVTGGQTMNPSTEDFLNAVNAVPAKNIYILPNNKNIILAATQVCRLVEDKKVFVIPSKTIPQGVAALISFDAGSDSSSNVEAMTEALTEVKTGQVTFAVRDTSIDSKTILEGDILGISDHGIEVVGKQLAAATQELIQALIDQDSELLSIYYGEDVAEEASEELKQWIETNYPELDIEMHYGGQPLYYYILSVE